MKLHSIPGLALVFVTAIAGASAVYAQSADAPTAEQLLEALSKKETRGVKAATASPEQQAKDAELDLLLTSLKEKTSRGLSVTEKERTRLTAAVEDKPQIDIEINFDFNSNDVSERARPVLMALGRALQKLDSEKGTFIVAGHTDGKGKQKYNQPLSERRAQAVKDFLVRQFNIGEDKLIVVGYGQEKLKTPKRPYADENRRVQIVNATSSVASAAH